MAEKWLTADLHIQHQAIIRYCNRPFKNVEEMNDSIFNILPYGNVQYNYGGSWRSTKRSKNILSYNSVDEIFGNDMLAIHNFTKFHSLQL